eukprot:scaffold920_cov93-Cylindrotheca_fusiformis.AAC.3
MKEELTTFLSHLDRLGWTAGAAKPDFADLLIRERQVEQRQNKGRPGAHQRKNSVRMLGQQI